MAQPTGVTYPRGEDTSVPLISDDPDEIRQQISHTRALMSNTITEIGERLSPDYILDKAKSSVREATVGRIKDMSYQANRRMEDATSSMSDTVRANPVPLALIGLGLGWLIMSDRSRRQTYNDRGYRTYGYRYYEGDGRPGAMGQAHYRLDEAAENLQDTAANIQGRVGDTARRVGDNVSDTAQRVTEGVSDTAQRVTEGVSDTAQRTSEAVRETVYRVGENVGHRAEMIQERASDLSTQARNEAERLAAEARWRTQVGVERTRQSFWEVMEENPLTLGAVVLVAGAAIGAAIPSTEYENRLLGETRDRLMEEARVRAQDTVGRVQTVLQDAQQAAVTEAKSAAQRENLPIGNTGTDANSTAGWSND